jgi:peptidoglycan/LPS O-acetylase OafA/YrhL
MIGYIGQGRATPLMFCFARLWEFALGIWLSQRFAAPSPRPALEKWPAVPLLLGSAAIYTLGLVSFGSRPGLIANDPLIGTGVFGLTLLASRGAARVEWLRVPLSYLGRNSYTIFLVHSLLMATPLVFSRGERALPGFVIFVLGSVALALGLDAVLAALGLVQRRFAARNSAGTKQAAST